MLPLRQPADFAQMVPIGVVAMYSAVERMTCVLRSAFLVEATESTNYCFFPVIRSSPRASARLQVAACC